MLPFYWREMKISHFTSVSKATFLKFVLAECLQRLSGLLMHVAEQTINMQLLNNLNQLQAVWVILLAYFIRGDKIDRWNFCNHMIIVVGVMAMCLTGRLSLEPSKNLRTPARGDPVSRRGPPHVMILETPQLYSQGRAR